MPADKDDTREIQDTVYRMLLDDGLEVEADRIQTYLEGAFGYDDKFIEEARYDFIKYIPPVRITFDVKLDFADGEEGEDTPLVLKLTGVDVVAIRNAIATKQQETEPIGGKSDEEEDPTELAFVLTQFLTNGRDDVEKFLSDNELS